MIGREPGDLRVVTYDVIGSTNAEALIQARTMDADACLFVAERQTAGRGRLNRRWDSEPGNVFATLLVRLELRDQPVSGLVFVAALAIWRTVRDLVAPRCGVRIKWPNDVLIDGQKVAGVLIETVTGEHGDFAAIGVGLNVVSHPATPMLYPATSLAACGSGAQSAEVVELLSRHLRDNLNRWRTFGFAPLCEDYKRVAFKFGEIVSISTAHRVLTGRFVDVTASAIVLRAEDGAEVHVAAGDM